MKFKKMIKIVLIFLLPLLSGCWNSKELTDLSIISAIGIDKTDKGQFHVSFQIINAAEVATGQEGGTRNASATVVYSAIGNTLFEAIRQIPQKVPRRIYFPHTNLIVISEEIAAAEGIHKVIDWFERDHEFRTNIQVIIARESKAKDILKILSPVEKIAAKKITNEIETTEKTWGVNLVTEIDDIIHSFVNNGKEIVISGIKIVGDQQEGQNLEHLQHSEPIASLELSGIALFKDGKLLHWLNDTAARGYIWIIDRVQSTIINLDYQDQKNCIAIEVLRSNSVVQSVIKNGKPTFTVSVNVEGNIGEANCPVDFEKYKTIDELEEQMDDVIANEIKQTISIAQQRKADIFGFGNRLHQQHPKFWNKYEDSWPELFSNSEVNVQVQSFIRRTGMRSNPIHTN
ncbi:hypothetical protein BKP37_14685 [Anaerobacillus alkalilacustris]|uniref:Uncharacterized protein n=1 Tax=Anaerobacillus alkalilacustris TaxID=393763 RepID=A0A1S2LHM7_9BACI|nr:Ger(x)C family spore germination protein [Anaerobacillus alkalilacustris]OIJ12022.1 hypothetical protein BKP37_14685 [Anaerobacillus alkalilacustris]